jgi:hypothetical protein
MERCRAAGCVQSRLGEDQASQRDAAIREVKAALSQAEPEPTAE